MTSQQLGILNSLVTYAAENVPGGLSQEEREVAQMVGNWVTGPTTGPRAPIEGAVEPTEREVSAIGWLSAELASRADAWNGNAPDWFPQPPQWLELWQEALEATK